MNFQNSRKMVWFVLWAILAITGAVIAMRLDGATSVAAAAVATLGGLAAAWTGATNWAEVKHRAAPEDDIT